ncbi:hydrogenase subunit [Candidatus Woesearchaeota archaeon]|nr:hydrogenase subunit [Candidatus Woesearchaeota archaeon]
MPPLALPEINKILLVLILFLAVLIITVKDLLFLNFLYRIQSFFIVLVSLALYAPDRKTSLLAVASITLLSKVIIIPSIIKNAQNKLKIKRDVEFHYLTPISSILVSIAVFFAVYLSFSRLITELPDKTFLITGSLSVSLMFMGMIIIFTRQQTITNIIGFLTIENGVLLFSLFMAELPLIVEVLILLDLVMLIVLASLLAFGIDSNIEEFHKKLQPLSKFLGGQK